MARVNVTPPAPAGRSERKPKRSTAISPAVAAALFRMVRTRPRNSPTGSRTKKKVPPASIRAGVGIVPVTTSPPNVIVPETAAGGSPSQRNGAQARTAVRYIVFMALPPRKGSAGLTIGDGRRQRLSALWLVPAGRCCRTQWAEWGFGRAGATCPAAKAAFLALPGAGNSLHRAG